MKALIRRHPVATYFALTFTISWGGVLLVIGGLDGCSTGAWAPTEIISTPGLERMARFLAFFVKQVDKAPTSQINP